MISHRLKIFCDLNLTNFWGFKIYVEIKISVKNYSLSKFVTKHLLFREIIRWCVKQEFEAHAIAHS